MLVFHLHGVVDALLIHVLRPVLIMHALERCREDAMTETQSTCGERLTDDDQYGTANLIDGNQRRRATDDRSRNEGRGEEADQRTS